MLDVPVGIAGSDDVSLVGLVAQAEVFVAYEVCKHALMSRSGCLKFP